MAVSVGDMTVIPVSDGLAKLPPEYFPTADRSAHAGLFEDDGTMHVPIGCFVVHTAGRTVLVDAGLGPRDYGWLVGGDLPRQLEAAGVLPSDIDVVVCSHLHADHAGWLVADDKPFFPNATVRFGQGDWDQFVDHAHPKDPIRQAIHLLAEMDRIDPIDDDGTAVAPGVTARFAPGHTHGHHVFVLSSGDQRAILLGDAVTCPVQLEEPDWQAMSDVDKALASRTREALWQELEGTGAMGVAAHFPGLEFGRVLRGEGRLFWS